MHSRKLAILLAVATPFALPAATSFAFPASASADFVHIVSPGESLTSIAATDGLTVQQLAAANELPLTAELIAGAQLLIPPQSESSGSSESIASEASASQTPVADGDGDADDVSAAEGEAAASTSGEGEAAVPTSTEGEAAATDAATSQPVGAAAEGAPGGPPYPTPEFVSPEEIGSIAAADGVPSSLAIAVAYMESGFNNAFTSSSNARGVMQITPGTWSWIDRELAGSTPLQPSSAFGNVRAGVLLLRSLLEAASGSEELAIAGYYQGLPSVLENGMYASTRQYVNDVLALEGRY